MTADKPKHLFLSLRRWKERLLWGDRIREQLFAWLLRRHYESLFKRLWQLNETRPHFTYHRLAWFLFGFGSNRMHPYQLFRAFYTAEVLRPGDVVLDIGCGDGFLTKHFLGSQCAQIDAIDIDPAAIRIAKRDNQRANVTYYLTDAIADPFPRRQYNVVVWNGAIGHFTVNDTKTVLEKIRSALPQDGLFVGSESLGHEGSDHLQFFTSATDLAELLHSEFPHVWTKTLRYRVFNTEIIRNEAHWRCSNSTERLTESSWLRFAPVQNVAAASYAGSGA